MPRDSADTPARSAYLDGAASMPPLIEASQAATNALAEFADPDALHERGRAARARLEHARAAVAAAIGADPDEVVLTTSGAHANALAVLGMVGGRAGRILLSSLEHSSVTEAALASGLEVVEVACDGRGSVDMDRFAALVAQPETVLASVH